MKAKTQIEQAVLAAYGAYADYCRKVDNVPVTVKFPRVSWERGSLKSENTGWVVDGRFFPGSAEQVISWWDKQKAKWERRLYKALPAVYQGETPEPPEDS